MRARSAYATRRRIRFPITLNELADLYARRLPDQRAALLTAVMRYLGVR